MTYSLILKRPRNKGSHLKNTNHVKINDGRVDSKTKAPVQHYYEKYMTMARESLTIGDRIAAEGYYQHAEHYLRVMSESKPMTLDAHPADNEENTQDELLPFNNDMLIAAPVELRQ